MSITSVKDNVSNNKRERCDTKWIVMKYKALEKCNYNNCQQ